MNYLFGSSSPAPATPAVTDDASPAGQGAEGRVLRVRIGPSLSSLDTYSVNNDHCPQFIDSPFFVGNIAVRVRNFRGRTSDGEPARNDSPYFGTRRRLFSIQMQGRFKHTHSFDDVVFGAEFENKVNPPTGAWVAMKFANMIDPALLSDLYSDKPWLYSPALCAMNIANVVKAPSPASAITNVAQSSALRATTPKPLYKPEGASETSTSRDKALRSGGTVDVENILGSWDWGDEKDLPESNELLLPDDVDEPKFPATGVNERRRYFGNKTHREDGKFTPDYVYNLEIFAPFIDLNTFDLNLGISVNLVRYLNNQPIRLVCKSLSKNIPFFIVEFDLEKEHQ
ncbi:hypothetical protein HDU83_005501 [Entophlyctis luteolus]|nr:hypothetical protein HDU83_005501 [Entophlyctis luteolus]KAJ3391485.1 hypothetical protein HDU84_005860 [Entophlyctis sp. JEL0112]